jgi:Co/Zn/Cd efflux system component
MSTVRYAVIGMDCADDAREIEAAAATVPGIGKARVSVASQVLTVDLDAATAAEVESAVAAIGYRLDAIDGSHPTHQTAAYRRALLLVVLLNAGYGVIEMAGGFLSDSQALKADALDFLGDGLITLLGVVAIGWGMAWRARTALVQGVFLGVLGLGVLGNTATRLVAGYAPEAGMMGAFAFVALLVNVAAAMVLLPHRAGDANVRAVWLFSRNDAIGNLAVVLAAGLVGLTGTYWPDVAVAVVIAWLFLHSAWSIIADARHDLAAANLA